MMKTARLLAGVAAALLLAAPVMAQAPATAPAKPATPAAPTAPAKPATPAAAPAAQAPKPAAAAQPAQTKKVNLNTATAAELDSLPQIGEARSKAIMEARAKGKFKNWDDFTARNVVPKNAEEAIKDKVSF